jgi:hypothetical protein
VNAKHRFAAAFLLGTTAFSLTSLGGSAATTQNLTLQATLVSAKAGSAVAPYSGTLNISINTQGNISGNYTPNSISYSPKQAHVVTVTGTLQGTKLHLRFGMEGGVQVDGTFANGKMTGTAYNGAREYNFKAYVEK